MGWPHVNCLVSDLIRPISNSFLLMYIFHRVSVTNCVRTYELVQACWDPTDFDGDGWQFGSMLTMENAWDGFVLLALLEDHNNYKHNCNFHISGSRRISLLKRWQSTMNPYQGQPEIAHYCDKWMQTYQIIVFLTWLCQIGFHISFWVATSNCHISASSS